MRAEDILPQALELPLDERTRLAALLMESIEASEEESSVEEAWIDEITWRLDENEKGVVRGIPAEVVFAEARDRVKRARG